MDERGDKRVSRRVVLKRIGAGAAVAWTAPILTSIRAPAFAQSGGACAGKTCPACNFGDVCGTNCACVGIPVECFCSNVGACNSVGICQNDDDCTPITGPGSKCAPCNFDPIDCVGGSCWGPCPGGLIPSGKDIRVLRPAR